MSQSPTPTTRITATPAARKAINALRATRGAPVMFVQSGGCKPEHAVAITHPQPLTKPSRSPST